MRHTPICRAFIFVSRCTASRKNLCLLSVRLFLQILMITYGFFERRILRPPKNDGRHTRNERPHYYLHLVSFRTTYQTLSRVRQRAVSYTHLDVYKRQVPDWENPIVVGINKEPYHATLTLPSQKADCKEITHNYPTSKELISGKTVKEGDHVTLPPWGILIMEVY